jgi:hypothetical protein
MASSLLKGDIKSTPDRTLSTSATTRSTTTTTDLDQPRYQALSFDAAPKDPWALPEVSHLVVGVLGGTGDQGRARSAARHPRITPLGQPVGEAAPPPNLGHDVEGADNAECARRSSDIVIVAVPGLTHAKTPITHSCSLPDDFFRALGR